MVLLYKNTTTNTLTCKPRGFYLCRKFSNNVFFCLRFFFSSREIAETVLQLFQVLKSESPAVLWNLSDTPATGSVITGVEWHCSPLRNAEHIHLPHTTSGNFQLLNFRFKQLNKNKTMQLASFVMCAYSAPKFCQYVQHAVFLYRPLLSCEHTLNTARHYFQQVVSADPNHERRIWHRTGIRWGTSGKHFQMMESKLPLKRIVYNQCLLPVMTYRAQTWRLA